MRPQLLAILAHFGVNPDKRVPNGQSALEYLEGAVMGAMDIIDDEDGTSGQDRESYSDEQDRDSYTVSTEEKPAEPLFSVVEYSSHFCVRHNPTGREAAMGDGVDTLSDNDGNTLRPGTPGFTEKWAEALNANESETLEAYFPDLAAREAGVKSAAEVATEVGEVLAEADGEFIEEIANQVLTNKVKYVGDSMFEQTFED